MTYIAIAVCWSYLVGLWLAWEISQPEDGEEVSIDLLGGLILLLWPIAYPIMFIYSLTTDKDYE
jgi:hypothetical protein